jgi:hypothetical protein
MKIKLLVLIMAICQAGFAQTKGSVKELLKPPMARAQDT